MYYYILEVRHELVSFSSHELSVWLSRIPFFNLVPGGAPVFQHGRQIAKQTVIRKPVALSRGKRFIRWLSVIQHGNEIFTESILHVQPVVKTYRFFHLFVATLKVPVRTYLRGSGTCEN